MELLLTTNDDVPIENYKKIVWKKNHEKFVEQINKKFKGLHDDLVASIKDKKDEF